MKLIDDLQEASISPEITVIEVQKLWFAEPETSPNGSPTVRVAPEFSLLELSNSIT